MASAIASSGTMDRTTAERLGFNATALDEYVAKPDASYNWTDTGDRLNGTELFPTGKVGWTGYVLNMTSQTWMTEKESNRPVWWHYLVVIIPDNVEEKNKDFGFLWITDGENTDAVPHGGISKGTNYNIIVAARIACETGLVTSSLF
jgi:PhoPQ-activated pathogenicity-related protein